MREIDLLRALPEQELAIAADLVVRETYRVRDVFSDPFIVAEGYVGIVDLSLEGREFVPLILFPGDLFPFTVEAASSDSERAESLVDGAAVYHVADQTVSALNRPGSETRAIVDLQAARHHREIRETLDDFALYSTPTHFARICGRLAERIPDHSLPFTREVIGRITGVSANHASELLSDLRKRGLVSYPDYGPIHVPDPRALSEVTDSVR